jgi:hypothetical protein
MCLPAAILPALSLVAGIAQSAVGYMGAKAEAKAQNQMAKANTENAKKATFDRFSSINNRVVQENAAASQELQESSIEGLKARASARTAAQEGGVSGVSVNSIIGDVFAREGRFAVNTQTNFDYSRNYWTGEGAAASAQGQSQVNSVPKVAKPSFLPYAVSMFGSAVKAFS